MCGPIFYDNGSVYYRSADGSILPEDPETTAYYDALIDADMAQDACLFDANGFPTVRDN